MTTINNSSRPEPKEMEIDINDHRIRPVIGLVANYPDSSETRFMVTPESCGMLHDDFHIVMETKAGSDINFKDEDFMEYGVEIVTRGQALQADLVLSFMPLNIDDVRKMRRGATLICNSGEPVYDKEYVKVLCENFITVILLDAVVSHNDECVFGNVLDEVDGRTAIFYCAEALSYLGHGNGTLLAGVAGICPCEVLIIGEGSRVQYAARTALALGAQVTLMDNDVSALQIAQSECGDGLVTCAIQPHILTEKVSRADVIILDATTRHFEFPKKLSLAMKDDVYMLDFNSLSPSISVPRTVAQAYSIPLINFLNDMALKNGVENLIALTPGVQCAVLTYQGQLVSKLIGSILSMPAADLRMMFTDPN